MKKTVKTDSTGRGEKTQPGIKSTSPSRNRYFYGKLLDVRDFELEQSYFNKKRRTQYNLLLKALVACPKCRHSFEAEVGPVGVIAMTGRECDETTLRPADTVRLKGVGGRFSGTYRVASVTHRVVGGYSISFEDPDGHHFTIDRESGTIRFGDGTHGKVPPAESGDVKARYKTGLGREGADKSSSLGEA